MLVNLTNLYTAISRKVVGKNVQATVPKGNMGYDQYTDSVAVEPTLLLLSFSTRKHTPMASPAILSNFFEEQRTFRKPPTIPFGIVACTFSDNLSRNSSILITY